MNSGSFEAGAFADVAVYLQDRVLENVDVEQLLGGLAAFTAARLSGIAPGLSCGITLARPKKLSVAVGSEPGPACRWPSTTRAAAP